MPSLPPSHNYHRRLLYSRGSRTRLSPRQTRALATLLPRWQLPLAQNHAAQDKRVTPALWFAPDRFEDYALEIGFGGGEHLWAQARATPERGFIGCEPFLQGIAKLLTQPQAPQTRNIRLHQGDGRDVLDALADASLAAIYLLYPDPWHKRRHHKRRFINQDNLAAIYRVLAPDGLLLIASDAPAYVDWTCAHIWRHGGFTFMAETASDWTRPPPTWQETRYEAKARRAGRKSAYLRFKRRPTPRPQQL